MHQSCFFDLSIGPSWRVVGPAVTVFRVSAIPETSATTQPLAGSENDEAKNMLLGTFFVLSLSAALWLRTWPSLLARPTHFSVQ